MKELNKFARNLYKMNVLLTKIEGTIMVLLMILIVLIMSIQIACRYVLYIPTTWVEELARYSFIWLAFIGSAYVTFQWSHLEINLVDSIITARFKNPEKILYAYRKFALIICSLFFVYFLKNYWKFVLLIALRGQTSAAMQINMVIPMSSGIVGLCLMLFHSISFLILPKSYLPRMK